MIDIKYLFIAGSLIICSLGCQPKTEDHNVKNPLVLNQTKAILKSEVSPGRDDVQDFRLVFKQLQTLLKAKNLTDASPLLNFPFFTARASENQGVAVDPITFSEYSMYKNDIFSSDVLRLLPLTTEKQLSAIDPGTDDPYYQSLAKLTDHGSGMFEVYFQYPETGTNAENYFAFVFGRIKGKYTALAMYAKWPVK